MLPPPDPNKSIWGFETNHKFDFGLGSPAPAPAPGLGSQIGSGLKKGLGVLGMLSSAGGGLPGLNDTDSSAARSGSIYGDHINTYGPNNGWIAQLLGGPAQNPAVWLVVGFTGAILVMKLMKK